MDVRLIKNQKYKIEVAEIKFLRSTQTYSLLGQKMDKEKILDKNQNLMLCIRTLKTIRYGGTNT